jgi:hypothetical protein
MLMHCCMLAGDAHEIGSMAKRVASENRLTDICDSPFYSG